MPTKLSLLFGLNDARRRDRRRVVLSTVPLAEYEEVLMYPRLAALHRKSGVDIRNDTSELVETATFVEPEESLHVITAPPDDNLILETAVAGKVEYIVSGDKHLLALGSYERIQIVPPATFAELIGIIAI